MPIHIASPLNKNKNIKIINLLRDRIKTLSELNNELSQHAAAHPNMIATSSRNKNGISELQAEILKNYTEAPCGDRSKILTFFIDKRLKELTESIGDF